MKAYSLDEILEMIPLGVFHYRVLLLCGLSFMCDALEVNLLSFLATCAGDEWGLSTTQKASISAVVFMGKLYHMRIVYEMTYMRYGHVTSITL
ncbi:hypothetical protein EON63_20350 [archaeon]|nr:MAG: hypothetical protein EON63_20350 [archaeon]